MSDELRIMMFDDSADLRDGLSHLIQMTAGFKMTGAFADCNQAIRRIEELFPDVILMDIDMPGINGIEGVRIIKSEFPDIKIIMLTVFEDEDKIFDALRAGASGYLLKKAPPAKIMEALAEVMRGGAPMSEAIARKVVQFFAAEGRRNTNEYALTNREKEVLQLLVNGNSYKMTAAEMNVSVETVRSHIKNMYDKLHVHSKSEAVAKALKDRLI